MSENDRSVPPSVVLGEDRQDELYALLSQINRESRTTVRLLLRAIIEEGRRFADTPEGRPYVRQLANSRLFKNGKVLWTMAGIDEFVTEDGGDDSEAPPHLDQILDALQHSSIEDYLMLFLEEYAEQRFAGNREGAGAPPFDTR